MLFGKITLCTSKLLIMATLLTLFLSLMLPGADEDLFEKFQDEFDSNTELTENYRTAAFLKPNYLIEDFNGNGTADIAVLIANKKTKKRGFIIYHPDMNQFYVLGAGEIFNEEAQWDDMNWVDNWQINHQKKNPPGVQGGPDLMLKTPSIEITKSEVGGGIIYWNGKTYTYFHQTC